MKKNYLVFHSISKDYPSGTYIGILNGQVVATADSYSGVADRLGCLRVELYLRLSVPPCISEIDYSCQSNNLPEFLVKDNGSPPVTEKSYLDWKEVAKPFPNELLEDSDLDRNFVKMRWVQDHPYCTIAVSNTSDSPCYAMTFLLDTSNKSNSVKDAIFHLLSSHLTKTGEKVLYIQGKRFNFGQSTKRGISNVNILGIDAFLELPRFTTQFCQAVKAGTSITYEEGRTSEDEQSLLE
jgi:hypothetical protein